MNSIRWSIRARLRSSASIFLLALVSDRIQIPENLLAGCPCSLRLNRKGQALASDLRCRIRKHNLTAVDPRPSAVTRPVQRTQGAGHPASPLGANNKSGRHFSHCANRTGLYHWAARAAV